MQPNQAAVFPSDDANKPSTEEVASLISHIQDLLGNTYSDVYIEVSLCILYIKLWVFPLFLAGLI